MVDKFLQFQYSWCMKSVVINICDDSKTDALLALLRDLSYVEIHFPGEQIHDDVYNGIPTKLDDDLLQSQLDILEKADW